MPAPEAPTPEAQVERASLWEGRVRPEGGSNLRAAAGLLVVFWLARVITSRPLRGRPGAQRAVLRALARVVRAHLRLRLHVSGLEHVRGGPFVIAPLHEGLLDPVVLLALPLPMRFAARDELFGWPLVGDVLRATQQIAVRPEQGALAYRELLRCGRDVVAAGESVVVFPQGTVLGIETDFTGGAFHLARALGVPVLPVALSGTHRAWEWPFTPTLRYGQPVSVRVLPPVPVETLRNHDIGNIRIACRRAVKAAALDAAPAVPRSFVPERDGWWDGYRYEIDPDWPELRARAEQQRLRFEGTAPDNPQLKEHQT